MYVSYGAVFSRNTVTVGQRKKVTATVTVGQRKKVTAVTFFRCPTVTVAVPVSGRH